MRFSGIPDVFLKHMKHEMPDCQKTGYEVKHTTLLYLMNCLNVYFPTPQVNFHYNVIVYFLAKVNTLNLELTHSDTIQRPNKILVWYK